MKFQRIVYEIMTCDSEVEKINKTRKSENESIQGY